MWNLKFLILPVIVTTAQILHHHHYYQPHAQTDEQKKAIELTLEFCCQDNSKPLEWKVDKYCSKMLGVLDAHCDEKTEVLSKISKFSIKL